MSHFKRKHSRRQVRCTMCTPHRWKGNARGPDGDGRLKYSDQKRLAEMDREIQEHR